jgi:predicted HAD superfamily Cof-like phosphohydrolase
MNVFQDQAKFMTACGQTVGEDNPDQFKLYISLIKEEVAELMEANEFSDRVEIFDALLDIIVVCIGAGHSAGFPMYAGWQEVMRSNMDKVDPTTGKVRRRADGKILKSENWVAPDLASLIK